MLRWRLVPYWADNPSIGNRLINARSETVTEKPSFREAFRSRRCLIPASGFFEWQRAAKGTKRPYFIRLASGAPMALAGLWDLWRNPQDPSETIESCTILTTEASSQVRPLHDRMPVIIPPEDFDRWLSPSLPEKESFENLFRPADPSLLEIDPVSPYVNKPGNEGPRCVQSLRMECPLCGKSFTRGECEVGSIVRCPKCDMPIMVG